MFGELPALLVGSYHSLRDIRAILASATLDALT